MRLQKFLKTPNNNRIMNKSGFIKKRGHNVLGGLSILVRGIFGSTPSCYSDKERDIIRTFDEWRRLRPYIHPVNEKQEEMNRRYHEVLGKINELVTGYDGRLKELFTRVEESVFEKDRFMFGYD
jgi:hypothetical protein